MVSRTGFWSTLSLKHKTTAKIPARTDEELRSLRRTLSNMFLYFMDLKQLFDCSMGDGSSPEWMRLIKITNKNDAIIRKLVAN